MKRHLTLLAIAVNLIQIAGRPVGVPNTLSIHEAERSAGVRTPILDITHSVLYQGKPAAIAMRELLEHDPRPENS